MSSSIPAPILDAFARAHSSWHPHLTAGLEAMMRAQPSYLPQLAGDAYLPTEQRLFAAFALPLDKVRYVLVGEGPYPRAESATGVCFMDGAVGELWCASGLSKPVNKATSLRNFMKMLLVADQRLQSGNTGGAALAPIAAQLEAHGNIKTLAQLQDNLMAQGFLLLNASLVFRHHVAPAIDAKAWLPFLDTVLQALLPVAPTLVLWGKIAEQLKKLPCTAGFPQVASEHPYNLSFIDHVDMQNLFRPMRLLHCGEK
ncbi:uracil-DNA glycosylase [Massilia sp. PAMC28688]|uniref:uracil-DNA glycosylase n=1 Tax=Massilia sp. PAMC28688 TaxID=2861283 RepID=UPI001C637216|nr:uracil-DNA glycosylase [Massilia sp. PAMC28688]QYF92344.1 uracil-DNA glycosylase [Massilia sp. PAMC28688]